MPASSPDDHPQTLLVTGAAGRIGGYLRHGLASPQRVLRLLDVALPPDADTDAGREEVYVGSITDRALVAAAVEGADAVVHLGGIAGEATWEQILRTNVGGSQVVFDAVAAAGVSRVVFASSNHAVGYWEHPADGSLLPDDVAHRPDTFYGWGKAAVESLGRLYHERYGMTVVNLRIGTCATTPPSVPELGSWLSPADCVRLVEAALSPDVTGFHTVWGLSANSRSRWSPQGGRDIGFRPQDDSERYVEQLSPQQVAAGADWPDRVGRAFTTTPLGEPM